MQMIFYYVILFMDTEPSSFNYHQFKSHWSLKSHQKNWFHFHEPVGYLNYHNEKLGMAVNLLHLHCTVIKKILSDQQTGYYEVFLSLSPCHLVTLISFNMQ